MIGTGTNAFGASSNARTITVNNGGTLTFAAIGLFGAHYATSVPTLAISGGTVTETGALNNPLDNVNLTSGVLTAANNDPAWGAWNVNGTITSSGTSLITHTMAAGEQLMLSSAGTGPQNTNINVADGILTVSTSIIDGHDNTGSFPAHATSLTKQGPATLLLTQTNTYTGGTNINAGILSFANGGLGSAGTVAFTGNSTLQWYGGNTQDISSGGRLLIDDGVAATFDTNGNNVTLASTILTGAARPAR